MFVKICGITNEDDALLATALGADALGFVFAPSRRQVKPDIVRDIVKRLPREITTVGVFKDDRPAHVVDLASRVGLHAVQLHGREPPESARWLSSRLPMVIQAFPAGDARVQQAADYHVHAVLLDAPHPGSGQVFDWSLASEVPTGQRLMIAGGLTAENVGAAVARARPWGVDAVSGIERQPGRKDPIKMRDFIASARAAAAELDGPPLPDRAEDAGPLYDWQAES